MTLSLTCKNCHTTINAGDEDELVTRVQAHVRDHSEHHGRRHIPSREQILARLHRANGRDATAKDDDEQPEPPE